MITPTFAYLFIFILHNIQCFEHKIDLKRCKPIETVNGNGENVTIRDAYCFIRDTCFKVKNGANFTNGDPESLTEYKANDNDELNEGTCDVIMQIKPFTTNEKWHVMMQVSDNDGKLNEDAGIRFNQKDLLFDCLPDSSKKEGSLKPKVYGTGDHFTPNKMFCSLTIEKNDKSFLEAFKFENALPTLMYTKESQQIEVKFLKPKNEFWRIPILFAENCDVNVASSSKDDTSSDFTDYLLQAVDVTLPRIQCEGEGSGKLMLRLDGKDKLIDKLYCKGGNFEHESDGGDPVKIALEAEHPFFSVYCARKFCSLCSDLPSKKCETPTDCVAPITDVNPADTCKKASCPAPMSWRQDDGSLADQSVLCKQNGQSMRWVISDSSGDKEITQAACSAKYDCSTYSKLDHKCPSEHPEAPECVKPTKSGDMYLCDEGYDMKYNDISVTNFTCDEGTGKYTAPDGAPSERNAHVVCLKRSEVGAAAQEQGMTTGAKAGIAFGVIALIIIAVIIVIVLCRRRKAQEKCQKSLNHSEGVKTAVPAKSMEAIISATGTGSKSQSGSEAPPSTDRPDKDNNKMPESSSNEKKEERKEEEERKEKDEKKKEKTKDKTRTKEDKEEKKKTSKTRTKDEEEEKKPAKKKVQQKVPMDMGKKSVPNLQQVNRELEQMIRDEGVDKRATAPKMDTTDLTIEQMKKNAHVHDELKKWGENSFQDTMLPLVIVMSRHDRVDFIHSVTQFEYYGSTQHTDRGTLAQFFQIVRRCHDKELDCKPTWEIIMRLIKLLCHHIPQKGGADVINRMKTMMRDIGNMLLGIEKIGYVPGKKDPPYQQTRREYALRMLLWFEDPTALEELRKMAEAKPEDVEQSVQTAVFAYAVNHGKREQLEACLMEELKKNPKEHPKPDDRPNGTLRQHLIYGLCADKNPDGMAKTLTMITKPWTLKPDNKIAYFTPADWHAAYKGATEHCAHFDRVLKWKLSNLNPDFTPDAPEDQFEVNYAAFLDEFAKDPDDRDALNKRSKIDFTEIVVNLVENCTTKDDFFKLYSDTTELVDIFYKHGQRCDYDSEMHAKRAEGLEKLLKSKACVESIDEALKKSDY